MHKSRNFGIQAMVKMAGWCEPRIKGKVGDDKNKFEKLRNERCPLQNAKDKAIAKNSGPCMPFIKLMNKKWKNL